MSDQATVEQTAIQAAKRRELIDFMFQVMAFGEAFASVGAELNTEVLDRALTEFREEGTKPSWNIPGIGKVTLSVAEDKPAVKDEAEFASWLAQRNPGEVAVSMSVDTAQLPKALEVLAAAGITATATLTPRDAFVKSYLDPKRNKVKQVDRYPNCTEDCLAPMDANDGICPVHPPVPEFIDTDTGETVPGLVMRPGRTSYITRTLDTERKELVVGTVRDFLMDRLARGIEQGASPLALLAGSAQPEAAPTPPPAPAAEPTFTPNPACRCGHTRDDQHRKGPKQPGGCMVTDCKCRRFVEDTTRCPS